MATQGLDSSDSLLFDEMRRGSSAALAALFDRHADAVYNYCFRRTASWHAAEDATSTVFLELWRGRARARAYDDSALPSHQPSTRLGALPAQMEPSVDQELSAGSQPMPATAPGWLVGLGAFAANRYDNSMAPGSTETLAPAGRATTPLPAAPSCGTRRKDDEVRLLDEPTLRGASVTAERGYGSGTTYLYETKSAWVVCDDLSASDGGSPTLFSPHDKSQSYQPDTSTLAISENVITKPDGTWASAQYVAAGLDFDRVQAISYAFPDGHTEDAVVGRNGLWSMTYLATDGPLVNPRTNALDLEPIEVTVDYTSGDDRTFTLEWALDTCAQINHGC